MTTIERTAYLRFKKTLSKQEPQTTYTPTPEEIACVRTQTDQPQSQRSACELYMKDYCDQVGLPTTAKALVGHLKDWLATAAEQCDHSFPDNAQLHFDDQGQPNLTGHTRRFGNFVLDVSQVPEPLLFELPFEI